MKIGEFLVKNNYISQETLNEVLSLQKHDNNLRIGELLVKMEAITKKDLLQYINEYIKVATNIDMGEAKDWLSQDQVDNMFSKYFNSHN
ncbi:hypothetical protein KsCSTR_15340 [Candidatus Kuenenia stuttgartiensis]|jgi:hypothetical protein|uniref:Type II secretion system protein GspE N-terminal domain-containing protein n=1 Tax=Kuenenia stuttgartiensis TaxID=174633 RepID=Q1Q1K2_KUEST|nr:MULTISPECIES: hypothetical protein [Kuenenia]MBE7548592.1 hypothetical protein [Planctomycetia bacterium]MBZ0191747.1 hypothetical protein [Candidatus Kuenenia stuttgartiensis]MCF6152250.1 hypothetical protein [Candidatus Kuenenia stuttgartiensis]MCL4726696.1 hypothetical protein [Candidatus Kuenenia stuttgartiensis]MCZ7621503.1 hypothetical protein [Candidatus Kuenenia sp.]